MDCGDAAEHGCARTEHHLVPHACCLQSGLFPPAAVRHSIVSDVVLLVRDAADRAPQVSSSRQASRGRVARTDPATPGRGRDRALAARVGAAAFLASAVGWTLVWRARRRDRGRDGGHRLPDASLAWRCSGFATTRQQRRPYGRFRRAACCELSAGPPVPLLVPFISLKHTDTRLGAQLRPLVGRARRRRELRMVAPQVSGSPASCCCSAPPGTQRDRQLLSGRRDDARPPLP